MAEPVRHRQTKGTATDMFDLQPPRHTSTLPSRPRILVASTNRRKGAARLGDCEGSTEVVNGASPDVGNWHLRDDNSRWRGSRLAGVRLRFLFKPRTATIAIIRTRAEDRREPTQRCPAAPTEPARGYTGSGALLVPITRYISVSTQGSVSAKTGETPPCIAFLGEPLHLVTAALKFWHTRCRSAGDQRTTAFQK
jgi:hypothetical protein